MRHPQENRLFRRFLLVSMGSAVAVGAIWLEKFTGDRLWDSSGQYGRLIAGTLLALWAFVGWRAVPRGSKRRRRSEEFAGPAAVKLSGARMEAEHRPTAPARVAPRVWPKPREQRMA